MLKQSPWLAILALLGISAEIIQAAAKSKSQTTDKLFDIVITTSKKKPTGGSFLDVLVHIKNVSEETLFLDKFNTELVFPSELSNGKLIGQNCSYFPNGYSDDTFYALRPNDETFMFCTTDASSPSGRSALQVVGAEISNFWSFAPGDFKLAVVLHYASDSAKMEHHVRTEELIVPVGAPQSVILLGAAIGGFCAYILFLRNKSVSNVSHWYKGLIRRAIQEVSNAFSAVLFSLVVTILLSRISKSQFLIKVTVEDLWGAVAVGFVSSYLGKSILDRLVGTGPGPKKTSSRPEGVGDAGVPPPISRVAPEAVTEK